MKKSILFSLMFTIALGWSGVVVAQTEETTTNVETERPEVKKEGLLPRLRAIMPGQNEKIEEARIRMEERKAEIEAKKIEQAGNTQERKNTVETRKAERVQNIEDRKEVMETRKIELAEKKEEVREEIKQRMADRKTEVEAKRKEMIEKRVDSRFEKVTSILEATIAREDSILEKIESRIEKVKTTGGDTQEADALMVGAKAYMIEAKTALEQMKTLVTNAGAGEEVTKETMDSVRTAKELVQKHLRNAHQSLMKIVGSLRGVSQINNVSNTVE